MLNLNDVKKTRVIYIYYKLYDVFTIYFSYKYNYNINSWF